MAASPDQLIEQAAEQQLAEQREWLSLLHYHDPGLGSPETYVDDDSFFVSPDGGTDAVAELNATLKLFSSEPASRCRFPARFSWLSTQLDFSGLPVSTAECQEFEAWRSTVNASDVVIVFAASYLNSPSSMYGHTFLRFDPPNVEQDSPLLSYALNFGATVTGNEASLLYAWRGIAGGYPGQFSANPYMTKIKEYTRLENRDLWEYHLNLTESEVNQMLAHVWELDQIVFNYYFFDENCSFRLLELIEVARPDLDLTSEFGLVAIPLDTVRAVEQAGLIEKVYYRPSNQTIISHNLTLLSRQEQRMALHLSDDISILESSEFLALSPEQQGQVAYVAYKYLRYEVNEEQRSEEMADRSFELLRFMARGEPGVRERQQPPQPLNPLEGHGTSMLSVGGGAEDGNWYADYEWRLSYHDLLDEIDGYPADTSLNMGRFVIRQREGDGFQLQQIDMVEITSTPPRDEFYKPLSWRTSVGVDRQWTNGDDELAYQANGGVGLSYRSLADGRLVLMLRSRAEYNDGFRDSKFDVAGGGSVMYLRQHPVGSTLLQFESLHFIGGTDRQLIEAQQNFVLTPNHALRLHIKRKIDESDGYNEAGLSYRYYF
ncbi:MAG: Lnb N-terminal periplasmic domain-containing protein [Gammaproteobacteria bacterium]